MAEFSFKHYGEKVTIELDHEDVTLDEFFDTCKSVALGAGFYPDSVKKYFGDD